MDVHSMSGRLRHQPRYAAYKHPKLHLKNGSVATLGKKQSCMLLYLVVIQGMKVTASGTHLVLYPYSDNREILKFAAAVIVSKFVLFNIRLDVQMCNFFVLVTP